MQLELAQIQGVVVAVAVRMAEALHILKLMAVLVAATAAGAVAVAGERHLELQIEPVLGLLHLPVLYELFTLATPANSQTLMLEICNVDKF